MKMCSFPPFLVSLCWLLIIQPTTSTPVNIYINTGGRGFTDNSTGKVWEADRGFNTGKTYKINATINGATPQTQQLYQTERFDTSDPPPLTYNITVPPGTYSVTLHFAEIYYRSVGMRVFHVDMEGTRFLSNYDVFQAAGNKKNTAVTATTTLSVSDGSLTVLFIGVLGNPKISGIEINSIQSVVPWIDLNENLNFTGRHECSFVQAGNKFYLFGGREKPQNLDVYDYYNNTWSLGAPVPKPFNHFQATQFQGLIWVIAAFKDNAFPVEKPEEYVYVYDPAKNVWMQGPRIPVGRERGGGGLVVYRDKFYVVGGNTNGHDGGFVRWMDEYDPRTAKWKVLPDAPRSRDHFHACVVGNSLYAAGGRRTTRSNTYGDTIPEVDVFDFDGGVWLTTGLPQNLPMPRASTATVVFDGKVFVIGGESGESTQAQKLVHALDPSTGVWSALSPLNYARQGSQAIVSGQGVYIVAGSPVRGKGNQKNMEVYNQNIPAGTQSIAGALSAPSSIDIPVGSSSSVSIKHVFGNQGVFVNSVTLSGTGKADFSIIGGFNDPLLIPIGSKLDISIKYTGTLNGATAQLGVTFSSNQSLSVQLVGRPSAATQLPTPTPPPSALTISDLIIVDAVSNLDISRVKDCNGCVTPTIWVNIRTESGAFGSVRLTIEGPKTSLSRLESVPPFAVFGDVGGDYMGQNLPFGKYTVSAQAFSASKGGGIAGPVKIETFTI